MLVLIPNGNADTWGIGLLGFLWEVVESVTDTLIKKWYNSTMSCMVFAKGWGGVGSIMELKLSQ